MKQTIHTQSKATCEAQNNEDTLISLWAQRCKSAIEDYSDDDPFTNLVDLMTDAMHWCDATGQDFHYALSVSGKHFVAELNDEQTEERRLP